MVPKIMNACADITALLLLEVLHSYHNSQSVADSGRLDSLLLQVNLQE